MSDNAGGNGMALHLGELIQPQPAIHIHIHVDVAPTNSEQIMDRLGEMELIMSAQSEALAGLVAGIQAVKDRIDVDVAHLRDLIAQAAATAADDATTIAALIAEGDAVAGQINAQTAALAAIDPDADYPVVPPVDEPPVDEPPVEPTDPPTEPPPV